MRHTLPLFILLLGTLSNAAASCSAPPDNSKITIKEPVDSIVIIKHQRQMQAFHGGRLLKTYHVSLGFSPVGAKHFRNDGKTPEGIYHIDGKNPHSSFHKALGVSYPAAKDIEYAKRFGKPTGGDIKIHGLPNGAGDLAAHYSDEDWTLGCIAITDEEIDELYAHVTVGIWVNILP